MLNSLPIVEKRRMSRETAKALLEIEAIEFNAGRPFILSSGWASPVYVDCRRLISYPRIRSTLMHFAASSILVEVGHDALDAVAGVGSAGIPYAAWIAERLLLPMQYIRRTAKGIGPNAQVEGTVKPGTRALLVGDISTDGRTKANFCDALRTIGARVDHCFVLFYYDIFPGSREEMRALNLTMHQLATWWDVLDVSRETGRFDAGVLNEIESFLRQPGAWSAAHGGIAAIGDQRQRNRA